MTRLLQINSSIFHEAGESTKLANRFVALWKAIDSTGVVTVRDLGDCPIPHLDAARFSAFVAPPAQMTAEQRAVLELSDVLIAELKAADIVVIGAPMYNLTVPSGLKAYIDHIARPGHTFRYTESGPVGLLRGKKAVVATARGGVYAKTEDPLIAYLVGFLSLLGIVDVDFVCAEGLNISDEARARGLKAAEGQMLALLERFAPSVGKPCGQTLVRETSF